VFICYLAFEAWDFFIMDSNRNRKFNKKARCLMGFFILVLLFGIFSWLFEYELFYCSTDQEKLQEHSIQWLEDVISGQVVSGLSTAKIICKNVPKSAEPQCIIELFKNNGISPDFINADYNKWDFLYWRNVLFFFSLAKSLTEGVENKDNDSERIRILFNAVHKCINPAGLPEDCIPWPTAVWQLKKGACDRQAWLFSELAYQLGFETQIVYLRNHKTKISPHTICEVRKAAKVWTADPFTGILLNDISVLDLSKNLDLKKRIWPDRSDWHTAIENPVFYTPSYPQAYAPRNQILYQQVKAKIAEYCPRFGESPLKRQKKYLELAGKQKSKPIYKLWFFPFRLMHAELVLAQILAMFSAGSLPVHSVFADISKYWTCTAAHVMFFMALDV
jgi:hypothetical protein